MFTLRKIATTILHTAYPFLPTLHTHFSAKQKVFHPCAFLFFLTLYNLSFQLLFAYHKWFIPNNIPTRQLSPFSFDLGLY